MVETRRGCKIRPGQNVHFGQHTLTLS
jgi:ribosome-associated protein YbcJ (S4-like RNA binding protein)